MDDSFIDGDPESLADEIDLAAGESEDFDGQDGEQEDEADEFGRVFRRLRRKLAPLAPVLRRLAPVAARAVMGDAAPGLGALLREEEDEDEDEDGLFEDGLSGLGLDEDEDFDGEDEDFEDEDLEGGQDPEGDAMAELLAAAAGFAESEEEAAGLIGGVTIQILGPAPVRIRRMTPALVGRAVKLTRLLRRSPRTRPLVPVVASITRATKKSLVRRAAQGRPVDKGTVARTMAKATARTLSSPKRVAKVLARNLVKRRRLDRKAIKRAERTSTARKTRTRPRPS